MPQYLLSVYQPEGPPLPPDELEEVTADLAAVDEQLKAAGAWVFAGELHPPTTATVLRGLGDEVLMTDGPFAESKEPLGGFTIIDVSDLDAALDWGGQIARASTLPVEVRPFQSTQG